MSNGNERFTQFLATSSHSFEMNDFMDRTTPQGYNMSNFVRRYAKYIDEKVISYRLLALDLCKIPCTDTNNALKKMNMDKISKTLPVIQAQFDALLEFGVDPKDLNNGIITYAFRLLCKDLFKMYVAYQELIINLLGRYFNLNHRRTREALDAYKGYLVRMDKVESLMRVTETIGLDKNEMPDFTKAPGTILATLERHYAQMDPKKRGAASTSPETQEQPAGSPQEPEVATPKNESTKVAPSIESSTGELAKSPTSPEQKPTGNQSTNNEASQPTGSKPARPSPVSVAKREPTQVAASKSSTSPSSTTTTSEKKVPPERPAKPPSRPPPPASSSSSKQTPPSPSVSAKSNETGESKGSKVSQAPPPPPPPPPGRPTTPSITEPTREQANVTSNNSSRQDEQPQEAQEQQNGAQHDDHGHSNSDQSPCQVNQAIDEDEQQQQQPSQRVSEEESNHVSNNHQIDSTVAQLEIQVQEVQVNVDEVVEMPPPPPPLNEADEVEEATNQVGVSNQVDGDPEN